MPTDTSSLPRGVAPGLCLATIFMVAAGSAHSATAGPSRVAPAAIEQESGRQSDARVGVTVPVPPQAFRSNGKQHLAYELHVLNHHPVELTLVRVEASAGDRTLSRIEGRDLRGISYRPGGISMRDSLPEQLGPGASSILFMWIEMDADASVPSHIEHRMVFTVEAPPAEDDAPSTEPDESTLVLDLEPLAVSPGAPVALAAPLAGAGWMAANGPHNGSGHRRALIPINGRAAIAQRYAIDWVQLNDNGRTWQDDRLVNANYRCYGAEALAVAEGVVVDTKDGIPENIPGATSRAVEITLETVGGNYVIIDIGDGLFAFYAHLQPGSLRVSVGDRVATGQVLGLVGNSGNSTEPHLHFHVGDKSSPLGAEGVPYVLDAFDLLGSGFGWRPDPERAAEIRRQQIPARNQVVGFVTMR